MSNNHENADTHEIHLNTIEGLDLFKEHFEEQYREFAEVADSLNEDVSQMLSIKKANEAYQKLQRETADAYSALSTTEELATDTLLAIQAAYDDFVTAYFSVTEETAEVESEEEVKEKPRLEEISADRELKKDSIVTDNLLSRDEVKEAIAEYFKTPSLFESTLWRIVQKIEEPSKLDKLLRVKHGSIFKEVLRGMPLIEIDQFKSLSGEQIRAALEEMQIEDRVQYDYRTYVAWMEEYDHMKSLVETTDEMVFEDLLALSLLIEKELSSLE